MNTIECGVIILEKNEPIKLPSIGRPIYYKKDGIIPLEYCGEIHIPTIMYQYFHLYFTSSEEIKEGDWYYSSILNQVLLKGTSKDKHPKIVASTDPSLGLPSIPQSFIKQYVAGNGKIDKVRLVLYSHNDCPEEALDHPFSESTWYQTHIDKLKLTANNEATIVDEPCDIQDKELEDAATSYWKRTSNANSYADFEAGANWQKERSTNDIILFTEWLQDTQFGGWKFKLSPKELYELWQQNKFLKTS